MVLGDVEGLGLGFRAWRLRLRVWSFSLLGAHRVSSDIWRMMKM